MTQGQIARWQPSDLQASLQQEDRFDRLDALLAGTGITRERFVGMTVQAVAREPKLLRCTRDSVLLSVLSVAEMGLVPNGAPGGAHLVPYGTECGYIVAYQGLITMAMRSGVLKDIYAKARYEADEFDVTEGTNPGIYHKPSLNGDRGNITHFYAVGHLMTGGRMQHVMTQAEVEAIRNRNKQWERGPWATDPVEMGRKTPVRNLIKYIPQALNVVQAVALEGEDRWSEAAPAVPAANSRLGRIQRRLTGGAEPDAAADEGSADGNGPEDSQDASAEALGGPPDEDKGMPEVKLASDAEANPDA